MRQDAICHRARHRHLLAPAFAATALIAALALSAAAPQTASAGAYLGAQAGEVVNPAPGGRFHWTITPVFNAARLRWEVNIPFRIDRLPQAGGGNPAGFTAAEVAAIRRAFSTWNARAAVGANLMLGAGGAPVDLESVVLHEVGHALGLGHPNFEIGGIGFNGRVNERVAQREPRSFGLIDGLIAIQRALANLPPLADAGPGPDLLFGTTDDTAAAPWPLFQKDRILYFDDAANDPFDANCGLPFNAFPLLVFAGDGIPVRENGVIAAGKWTQEAAMVQGVIVDRELQRDLLDDDLCALRSLEAPLGVLRFRLPLVYQFVFNPGRPVEDLPGPDGLPATADDIDSVLIGGVVQANGMNLPRHTVDVFRKAIASIGLADSVYDVPNLSIDASDIFITDDQDGGGPVVGTIDDIEDDEGVPIPGDEDPYDIEYDTQWPTADCDNDTIPDLVEIQSCLPLDLDCQDCDNDLIPDGCQTTEDCNSNGIPDLCDLADGTSQDCTGDYVPDECNIADGSSLDTDSSTIPDECELPAPSGACCDEDEVCTDAVLATACAGPFDEFHQNVTCGSVTCPPHPRGACCNSSSGSCADDIRMADCAPSMLEFRGDGSTCSSLDEPCGPVTGACCDEDGVCSDGVEEADCAAPYESFSAGETCSGIGTCPALETGACCDRVTGSCSDGVRSDGCVSHGKEFHGSGSTCSGISPSCAPATGACCDLDQTCSDGTLPGECGGTFFAGQTCGSVGACPGLPVGACCDRAVGYCEENVTSIECQGEYQEFSAGQSCPSCEMLPLVGACCLSAGVCLEMMAGDCASNSGGFVGLGTSCGGDGNSNNVDDQCESPPLCGASPEPDGSCRLAGAGGAGKSSIQIKNRSDNERDALRWKWSKGVATAIDDFKLPVTSTNTYRVCLYDTSGKLRELDLPPGGVTPLCDGSSCWKATSTVFRYKNNGPSPDGITRAKMKPGTDGRSQVQIKAKGSALIPPPTAGLSGVVIQLLIDDGVTTECFKTSFPNGLISKQDDKSFKAKGP